MKTRTLLTGLLMTVLAAVVAAPASSPEKKAAPAGPELEQLVEQLGDADYRKRDIALDLIKAEGDKALPVLRASLKHTDPEVRRRVLELIPSIETAVILTPKRVTLQMKDKSLKEIFDELTKQTGYKYEFSHTDQNAKFSVDLNNLTLWEAVEQLTKTTGLDLQQSYGDDRLRFNYRGGDGGGSPYSCRDGAFRLSAASFQLYKSVDLTQPGRNSNQRSENLTFSFIINSEPKLPMLGIGQPRVTAAFDSDKNSMLIGSHPNEYIDELGGLGGRHGRYTSRYGNGNRMWYTQTQINLNRVSEKTTSVKLLRGTLPVTLLSEQKPHIIAAHLLKAKGTKATVGSTTVQVEDASLVANTNQVQVRITFTEDTGGNPNDYSWQNSIYQRLEVQDAKGAKYQVHGQNWGNSSANSMQITFTYAPPDPNQKKPDDNLKLVFHEWKVLHHQLNFEFKDLPLP